MNEVRDRCELVLYRRLAYWSGWSRRPTQGSCTDCGQASHARQGERARESDSLELSPDAQRAAATDLQQFDEAEQQMAQELRARDREVRSHEAAHAAAAGPYAQGGPSFTYQKGPDGRSYAIGGEVQIDVSPVNGDPEATIRKMQVVRAAALAPADPSSQDRAVAAIASRQEAQAVAELAKQQKGQTPDDEASDDLGPGDLGHVLDVFA